MAGKSLDDLAIEINTAGIEWADLDGAASLLEETRRTLLAQLQIGAGDLSMAAREMYALANQDYRDHVAKMVEARRMANRALVRYKAMQVLADMRRTQESTRRAELKALGG